jgi:two-component system chemotaxis response regulator CheB
MPKIRVLIVDDAVVIRKILMDELMTDPEIEVVGTAPNGKIALQKIPQLQPDIVTLDVEMPEMDGLETLVHLRKDYPKLPVIMFSTLTERGAAATMEALARGASDYVTKPANVGKVTNAKEAVREDLIRKIKALVFTRVPLPKDHPVGTPKLVIPKIPSAGGVPILSRGNRLVKIVVVAVSTGGPNALAKVIPLLPEDLEVPIVMVQHMPPMFTKLLAERLDSQSKLKVVEGADGMPVQKGHVYIAPGNFHMVLRGTSTLPVINLNQEQPENSCRPAADPLFRSAVQLMGGDILGVVLTGMGQDGMLGCRHIKESGGVVVAQDRDTSVVWGMPGAVVEEGLADKILPLESIAGEIIRAVRSGRSTHTSRGGALSC